MSDSTALPLTTVANTGAVPIISTFDGTDDCMWLRPLNPVLGVGEVGWISENHDGLTNYRGRWVAVLGNDVITDGASALEVHEYLKARQISGALVTFVHDVPNVWDYLIA